MFKYIFALLTCFSFFLFAEEEKKNCLEELENRAVKTSHTAIVNGEEIDYEAEVGLAVIKDEKNCPQAAMSYTAYTKENIDNPLERPITFCFNGGPGSSSIWLHMGAYGPKRVALDSRGKVLHPAHAEENPYSLLDVTDLVFIDPVSTGYSQPAPGEEAKKFHSVDDDIKSVGEFIRLYVTRNNRWESPKYISGESYGTTRACGLAHYLQENKNMFLDGVILISSILNFQTIISAQGNDLPSLISLPTMAITAWYYHRIPHDKYPDIETLLKEAEDFSFNEYAAALMKGDALSQEERVKMIKRLSFYTGVSESYIDLSNLHIHKQKYLDEFMQKEKKILGRFDVRMTGDNPHPLNTWVEYDPSIEEYIGPYTAVFNHYMRTDLNWKDDTEYKVLARGIKWDFTKATNRFLDVSDDLLVTLSRNPRLRVFIANGYYDMALPVAGTKYTLNHMGLNAKQHGQITLEHYPGGHMMYHEKSNLKKLKNDLRRFFS